MNNRTLAQSALILGSVGLICRDYGPVSSALEAFLLTAVLTVYSWISISGIKKRTAVFLTAIVLSICVARFHDPLLQLCLLAVQIFFMHVLSDRSRKQDRHQAVLLLTVVSYLLLYTLYRCSAEGWYAVEWFSDIYSSICSVLFTREIRLGPTAFGLLIVLVFILYHTWCLVLTHPQKRSFKKYFLTIAGIAVLNLMYVETTLVAAYVLKANGVLHTANKLHLQGILYLFLLATVAANRYRDITLTHIRGRGPVVIIGLACTVLSAACLYGMLRPRPAGTQDKTIAFYTYGSLDWKTARWGSYGQRSGGMFGMMPEYLKASGFETKMIESLTPIELADADALVMINLNRNLSRQDLFTVWQFVRHGGGLLLLGDHTDLSGLMQNFNELLMHVPLRFAFDSAMPSRYTWDTLMDVRPHPITSGFEREIARAWWVGASITCAYPAVPLAVGKYCYADIGNKTNRKHAYLGNRVYETEERLNDVVLAAAADYGNGRIMACGDTSAFHNTVFISTHSFVINTMNALADRQFSIQRPYAKVLTAVCALSLAVLLVLGALGGGTLLPAAAAAAVAAAIVSAGMQQERSTAHELPFEKLPIAYIDYSHAGRFDLMSWEDDSIGGLKNNLMRNGYWPFLLRAFDEERIMKSKVLIFIAPAEPFTEREIKILDSYMQSGGRVIVSAGWEERDACDDLLAMFGIGIDGMPLARCSHEVDLNKKTYRGIFHEAWPVNCEGDGCEVQSMCMDYPVVVSKRIGSGMLTVVGDSSFLLNEALEGKENYSMANMLLFRNLLNGRLKD